MLEIKTFHSSIRMMEVKHREGSLIHFRESVSQWPVLALNKFHFSKTQICVFFVKVRLLIFPHFSCMAKLRPAEEKMEKIGRLSSCDGCIRIAFKDKSHYRCIHQVIYDYFQQENVLLWNKIKYSVLIVISNVLIRYLLSVLLINRLNSSLAIPTQTAD